LAAKENNSHQISSLQEDNKSDRIKQELEMPQISKVNKPDLLNVCNINTNNDGKNRDSTSKDRERRKNSPLALNYEMNQSKSIRTKHHTSTTSASRFHYSSSKRELDRSESSMSSHYRHGDSYNKERRHHSRDNFRN